MASDLLKSSAKEFVQQGPDNSLIVADQRMRRDSLIRASAVVLAILTVATIVFAAINFQKENQYL
ncbi:MAG TPA: hypothetical protein VJ848_04740, partial [Candidatus Angelobacter sp.]|nr:hypothetical protein [Candidatus Angelobacter sp.]